VRFTWEPNSIAIWDNFGTQHYAVGDYWPNDRLMQRITVGTATPTAAFSPQRLAAE
jgi:alpha-ketoglutarate-dependent taurine dioxygenase